MNTRTHALVQNMRSHTHTHIDVNTFVTHLCIYMCGVVYVCVRARARPRSGIAVTKLQLHCTRIIPIKFRCVCVGVVVGAVVGGESVQSGTSDIRILPVSGRAS